MESKEKLKDFKVELLDGKSVLTTRIFKYKNKVSAQRTARNIKDKYKKPSIVIVIKEKVGNNWNEIHRGER